MIQEQYQSLKRVWFFSAFSVKIQKVFVAIFDELLTEIC